MENFAVTCQLIPGVPHLISGSCSSPRMFGSGFLQTPPHDDALALLLTFGSANTWYGDFHPVSPVPCPAHTTPLSCGPEARLLERIVPEARSAEGTYFLSLFCICSHIIVSKEGMSTNNSRFVVQNRLNYRHDSP